MFLCLVKLTIHKTIGCLFGCKLREMGELSQLKNVLAKNELDPDL